MWVFLIEVPLGIQQCPLVGTHFALLEALPVAGRVLIVALTSGENRWNTQLRMYKCQTDQSVISHLALYTAP